MALVTLPTSTADLVSNVREDELLVGVVNGSNQIFFLPNADKAINEEPGAKVKVYYNGQRIHEGGLNDFTIDESGGPGTGFDRITVAFVPAEIDKLTADYFVI